MGGSGHSSVVPPATSGEKSPRGKVYSTDLEVLGTVGASGKSRGKSASTHSKKKQATHEVADKKSDTRDAAPSTLLQNTEHEEDVGVDDTVTTKKQWKMVIWQRCRGPPKTW